MGWGNPTGITVSDKENLFWGRRDVSQSQRAGNLKQGLGHHREP